ncbi:MAG: hypothetical protein ACTSPV_00905 [Candidatus Hodarchaeales archaeon]
MEIIELHNFDFIAKPEYEGKIIINDFTDSLTGQITNYSILYQKNSTIYTLITFVLVGFDIDNYTLKMKDLIINFLENEIEKNSLSEDEICTEGHVEVDSNISKNEMSILDKLYSLTLLSLKDKFSADDFIKLREKGII